MKYRCTVCGHIYDEEKEGVKFADLPADWKCPTCKQPKDKFVPVDESNDTWAAEHVVGIAKDVPEDIKNDLRAVLRSRHVPRYVQSSNERRLSGNRHVLQTGCFRRG